METSYHTEPIKKESAHDLLDEIFISNYGVLPFDRIGILLLEDHDQTIRLRWAKSLDPVSLLKEGMNEHVKDSILEKVIETGLPEIIPDFRTYINQHPNVDMAKKVFIEGISSAIICPLHHENKIIGAVVFSCTDPGSYSLKDINHFSDLAEEISSIIELKQDLLQ